MKRKPEKRGHWYLLTGLILGVVFGLVYAWVFSPVEYVDAGPNSLRADFKDQYRLLVALAYLADNNLVRAEARLNTLKDADIAGSVAMQAQRYLADGKPEIETHSLSLLAVALGGGPTPVVTLPTVTASTTPQPTITPTPVVVEPTSAEAASTQADTTAVRTLQPTTTPLPTRTPTATVGAPFLLQEQTLICEPAMAASLIQIKVYDASGQEVPGVEAVVTWSGGEEHFFTGLKPELGLGYADFSMTTGISYALRLADGGQGVPDLTPAECEGESGARFYGSWLLVFRASGR
jgi:hypothetical protein